MGVLPTAQNFSQANFGIKFELFADCRWIGPPSPQRWGSIRHGAIHVRYQLLDFNVGLPAQTGANGYIGNYAASNYNALLVSLRKHVSNGFQFDLNYTFRIPSTMSRRSRITT